MKFVIILIAVLAVNGELCAQKPSRVMVIAHRGASAYAPENTIAAFRKAVELKADALEVDVRQSKDAHLVILHDATVNRTTNGKGNVADLTLDELRQLDAGSWFNGEFEGEGIPTLEEVVALLDTTTVLIIEVKEGSTIYPNIERHVVDVIKNSGKEKQVILKSFDREVLDKLKELAPSIARLYVYAFHIPWLGLVIDRGITVGDVFDVDVQYLQPHWYLLTQSFTKSAQQKGLKVVAWGVDDEKDMKKAISYGVDGIETDYPDVLRKVINKN